MYKKIAVIALAMFALTACASEKSMESKMMAPAKGQLFKVYFPNGGDSIDPQAQNIINEAAALASRFENPRVVVSGYSDRKGSSAMNERLSLKRAQKVAAKLALLGVGEGDLKIQGYGERYPDVRTDDGVSEAKNRRVEIQIAP